MPYLTPAAIETRLSDLASAYSTICSRHSCTNVTHEGRTVYYLKIAKGTGSSRPNVLVIAGVHAREWAPPDALLSFTHKLLNAYKTSSQIIFPGFKDTASSPTISYPRFRLPFPDVRRIVEKLNLFILPCVNPDGRNFSMSSVARADWRKNRSPHADPACMGVDINRNFDIAWDFDKYYSTAAAAGVSASKNHCNYTYIGSASASEPETENIQDMILNKNINFFVDVHSYSRLILYPWSIEENQSSDSAQSFQNSSHNFNPAAPGSGRDGKLGDAYREFFPNNAPVRLLDRHVLIGNRMKNRILGSAGSGPIARSRSTYTVEQPINVLYAATGVSADYAFSRQLINPALAPIYSFTIECGSRFDGEGGFHPDYVNKYPKIEREVHAALSGLLSYAAAWHRH